ncbi:hypothetical protein EYF80_025614 [Liparis tanakae]|uniref:Uncharacterized protein n=1 Tax=Liparis tanakae TaxID=230148 RepID=A0A4Z2HEH4_9TELE|nr:hypothetical protein EYF80_025614 [Liparis tanakae]
MSSGQNPRLLLVVLSTLKLTMGTSTTFSCSLVFPPVVVYPHPATRHFDLSFIFILAFGR